MTKIQKDKKTKRQKDKKTKRQIPNRELNIATSGQFRTLAMFLATITVGLTTFGVIICFSMQFNFEMWFYRAAGILYSG